MPNCPLCNSVIEDDNPGILADKIDEALKDCWDNAESDYSNWGWPVGKTFEIGDLGLTAEVVAKNVGYAAEYRGRYDLPQGTEFDTFVILKVGEHHFKKVGFGDSYGNVSWTGPCRPVAAVERLQTVYEPYN